jgi:hypothetical protein
VFCAGIHSTVPEWTAEGLERNFVLNYLSRYLLARQLLPALTAAPSGRLVLVANAGMYRDSLNFDDLQHRRGKAGITVAGRTQFANDLLTTELGAKLSVDYAVRLWRHWAESAEPGLESQGESQWAQLLAATRLSSGSARVRGVGCGSTVRLTVRSQQGNPRAGPNRWAARRVRVGVDPV